MYPGFDVGGVCVCVLGGGALSVTTIASRVTSARVRKVVSCDMTSSQC